MFPVLLQSFTGAFQRIIGAFLRNYRCIFIGLYFFSGIIILCFQWIVDKFKMIILQVRGFHVFFVGEYSVFEGVVGVYVGDCIAV